MDQLDLIKDLLDESFLDNTGILSEKGITAKKKAFKMTRRLVPHSGIEYLLFRYDPDKTKLFPYFKEKSGLKKICDYILFVEEKKYLHILLIELKLGAESANNQLVASECFVKFVMDSAERIGINFTKHIKIVKIRISEERSNKIKKNTTKQSGLERDEK